MNFNSSSILKESAISVRPSFAQKKFQILSSFYKVLCFSVLLMFASSCLKTEVNSESTSISSFETIHDLRFTSPPGVLDSRTFIGIEFSEQFLSELKDNQALKIKDSTNDYLFISVSELRNLRKLSFVPHSLNINGPFYLEVFQDGQSVRNQIVQFKTGKYNRL